MAVRLLYRVLQVFFPLDFIKYSGGRERPKAADTSRQVSGSRQSNSIEGSL